jgi:ArsR family transcriptional regulator
MRQQREAGGEMDDICTQRLKKRAFLLKSMAHPSRLLILEMLEKSPRCVWELTEVVGADITTVSKHLAVMKRAGLVKDVKRGTFSEYSLACECITHFIDCIEDVMNERACESANEGEKRIAPFELHTDHEG